MTLTICSECRKETSLYSVPAISRRPICSVCMVDHDLRTAKRTGIMSGHVIRHEGRWWFETWNATLRLPIVRFKRGGPKHSRPADHVWFIFGARLWHGRQSVGTLSCTARRTSSRPGRIHYRRAA